MESLWGGPRRRSVSARARLAQEGFGLVVPCKVREAMTKFDERLPARLHPDR